MAAASLSAAPDFHLTITHHSDKKKPILFTSSSPITITHNNNPYRRRLTISCNSRKTSKHLSESPNPKNPSLSDQLKPLSSTTLSTTTTTTTTKHSLLSKPNSTWVNPTKPKRSVLSLQRQKRSPYSLNPKVKELRLFAQKLNDCDSTESSFLSLLEQIPYPLTRENALLILNSLRPWQKAHLFFNWIKTQNSFPVETIFYNVTMKSLRFGRQFELIDKLANEMVSNEIELDNITYSTIITCAKRCNRFDMALEWFERMYKTGLMPDEVTYSAILDVYAKLGRVEEVLSLYERGVASGWKPDPITFSVLAKMFGEAGDYDGIRYVLQEMKSLAVQPNVVVYNTLLEAMGKAGKPGLARSLFDEMVESGLTPNEKTLTALAKIYGKARWAKDAMELWERMRSNDWPMDFILYNTLLSMCADLGMEKEAETLFEDMKRSEHCSQICLGKANRVDDLVRVFNFSMERGVNPDDRLCGCLLSVVSLCEESEDVDKVLACLQVANPKLVALVKLIAEEESSFETVKEEFKAIVSDTAVEARRPFCNCLIDVCRNRNLHGRAHELLYLGSLYGLYPDLHNKTEDEWSLDVRSLSVGAAHTALEEWMGTLVKFVQRNEALPEIFSAHTGTGTHKFSQGLANAFASHVEKLAAPFRQSEEKAGCFVATREDLVTWAQSRSPSLITS
ncbi:pentatricopeptide repeat-containing protein, putative [Ricinus communis]|uniref:Pentatricopeptide repeat-containing protein, putative n=1 Tax=Ricinus communis TaxID=3988 RepID=B9S1H7_RICCO|nr:pentatricopeptide repeat-containing protein, putative [Ricinus communis]